MKGLAKCPLISFPGANRSLSSSVSLSTGPCLFPLEHVFLFVTILFNVYLFAFCLYLPLNANSTGVHVVLVTPVSLEPSLQQTL